MLGVTCPTEGVRISLESCVNSCSTILTIFANLHSVLDMRAGILYTCSAYSLTYLSKLGSE